MLVYGRLAQRGAFAVGPQGIDPTPQGATLVAGLGVVEDAQAGGRRPFCRTCMDWSERRHHLAGVLGATCSIASNSSDGPGAYQNRVYWRSALRAKRRCATGRADPHSVLD